MNNQEIIKEIELLEAQADIMKDCCNRLKEKLGLSTKPMSSKAAMRAANTARILANFNKSLNKKALAARTANANPSK